MYPYTFGTFLTTALLLKKRLLYKSESSYFTDLSTNFKKFLFQLVSFDSTVKHLLRNISILGTIF